MHYNMSAAIKQHIRSLAATFSASLGSITLGYIFGYTATTIPNINANKNPFHLSNMDISLVTSIASIGGMLGGPFGGLLLNRYGRKCTLMLLNFSSAIGWAIIAASSNVYTMCIGRFMCGYTGGIVDVAVSVYIVETSHPKMRGLTGTCHALFCNIGVLLVYAMSYFLNWVWLAIACQTISVVMVFCMYFMVESPRWLLTKGYKEAAKESLQWLRNQDNVLEELTEIENNVKMSSSSQVQLREFMQPKVYRPLLIIITLFFVQQFSGGGTIPSYLLNIFLTMEVDMNVSLMIVIVQTSGLVAVIISANLVDRFGRKFMLCISAAVMAIGMGGLALFFSLKHYIRDFNVSSFSWLPIQSLILYYLGLFLGYNPIPFYLATELFPLKTRGIAGGIGTFCLWLFTFLSTLIYPHLVVAIGEYGIFWIFTVVAVFGFIFPIIAVPETKGKTLEEIEMHFNYQ